MIKAVVDTNVLMRHPEVLQDENYEVYLPITVPEELDAVKIRNKNEEARFQARRAVRALVEHIDSYKVLFNVVESNNLIPKDWEQDKNDNAIVAAALNLAKSLGEEVIILTNDINMQLKAKTLKVPVMRYSGRPDLNPTNYAGWTVVKLDDQEISKLFSAETCDENYGLSLNEYLIVTAGDGESFALRYNGSFFVEVENRQFKHEFWKPTKARDLYQQCLVDCLINNQFTVITGHAGTGKSYFALSYALWALRNGHFSKIIVATNPVKARGTSDVGFYPGTKIEKLMSNNVGGMLITKFGDSYPIEAMMQNGQLELQTLADIRGSEIPEGAILYLPEMQNSTIEIAKLAAQRLSEGAKIIAEGDIQTQVDNRLYENENNGLRRYIEVFSGEKMFGHVELPIIYRSRVAEIADKM